MLFKATRPQVCLQWFMGGGTLISPRIIPHPPILPGIYAYDCSFSISLLSNTLNSGKLECNSVTCFWKSVLYFGPCLTFTADGWQAACLHCKLFSPFKVMHVGRVSPNCATLLRVSPPPPCFLSALGYPIKQAKNKKRKQKVLHVVCMWLMSTIHSWAVAPLRRR